MLIGIMLFLYLIEFIFLIYLSLLECLYYCFLFQMMKAKLYPEVDTLGIVMLSFKFKKKHIVCSSLLAVNFKGIPE